MEQVRLILDNDQGRTFDLIVHHPSALPSGDDLTIVTKDNGTQQGNPIVAIAFPVQLPDGSVALAQFTTTVKLLQMSLAAFRGRYGDA